MYNLSSKTAELELPVILKLFSSSTSKYMVGLSLTIHCITIFCILYRVCHKISPKTNKKKMQIFKSDRSVRLSIEIKGKQVHSNFLIPASRVFKIHLKTCHQLHLSFSHISFRDTAFFVNRNNISITVTPADLIVCLKLVPSSEIGHAFVVNVLVVTPL